MNPSRPLPEVLANRHLLVMVGGGGVGKTTLAAALALGVRRGRRSLVLTIDPARRLASALGLEDLGDEPTEVAPRVDAMMLDRKRAWDRLVARHASSADIRERILANRVYRELSASFAGAHEILALEEIAEIVGTGRYDLVVVDTPPAHHAFEFLGAPERMRGILDRRFVRWLFGAQQLAARLEVATGRGPLSELARLFGAMDDLFAAFRSRLADARALLASRETAILLVAGPGAAGADEALGHHRHLAQLGLPALAVLLNRAHPELPDVAATPALVREALATVGLAVPEPDWVIANFLAHRDVAAAEARAARRLRAVAPVGVLPRLESDVHDLIGLAALANRLAALEVRSGD